MRWETVPEPNGLPVTVPRSSIVPAGLPPTSLVRPETWSARFTRRPDGRELVVGGFLGPMERKNLATALKQALVRWREHINPARN